MDKTEPATPSPERRSRDSPNRGRFIVVGGGSCDGSSANIGVSFGTTRGPASGPTAPAEPEPDAAPTPALAGCDGPNAGDSGSPALLLAFVPGRGPPVAAAIT